MKIFSQDGRHIVEATRLYIEEPVDGGSEIWAVGFNNQYIKLASYPTLKDAMKEMVRLSRYAGYCADRLRPAIAEEGK